ncbi:MAG: hypothetical protein NT117_01170 [Gammaproteobacteria bacterium]|nr:hypothetical protein [Gammaproteobacteria bacterium]
MNDIGTLTSLMGYLTVAKWVVGICALSYFLRAFGLSLLGAQAKLGARWTAWVPLLNNYLVCRLAKAPAALMLPAMIPLLNVLVDAYLGVGMAKAKGRSTLLGLCYGVPVFGNVVPLMLGLGAPVEKPLDESEHPPLVSAFVHAGVACSVLIGLGLGAFALGYLTRVGAPPSAAKVASSLPPRVAGTLSEFPIDSDQQNAALPGNVVTQSFGSDAKPIENEQITQDKLPPWIAQKALPGMAASAIAAEYAAGAANARVDVVGLEMRGTAAGSLAPPSAKQLGTLAKGAKVSGIELKSAKNETYRGYRVTSPEAAYYVLQKEGTSSAVLISATNADSIAVAERLAANIGGGSGLLEYQDYREVFASVPPPPAADAELKQMNSFTEADISRYMAKVDQFVALSGEDIPNDMRNMYPVLRQIAPQSVIASSYESASQDVVYGAMALNFPSSAKAWATYQLLDSFKTVAVSMIPSDAPFDYQFETQEIDGVPMMVFNGIERTESVGASVSAALIRRGGSVVILFTIQNGKTLRDVTPWAKQFIATN